jgi:hypothetical protein
MIKRILLVTVLVANVANATEAVSVEANSTKINASGIVPVVTSGSTRNSGWYAGAGIGLINWGGSVTIDNGYRDKTYDVDTEDKPMMLKIGYVTENENRIELYFKNDAIDAEENDEHIDMYDTSTFGINYQWGISSLSTNEILPYIRVGIGFGSADLEGATVDVDAIDFDLGLGVYYDVAPNIDLMVGVYRRAVGISSEESDTTIVSVINGLEFGANYHF